MEEMTRYERELKEFYKEKREAKLRKEALPGIRIMDVGCTGPQAFYIPSDIKIFFDAYFGNFFKENFEKKLPYDERVKLFEKMKAEGIKKGIISPNDETLQYLYPKKTFFERVQEHLRK
jgi:hypothetical protein